MNPDLDELTPRYLQPPASPPQPVPGCGKCATLDAERARATRTGDYSAVSDCNVRMRTHEHTPPIPQ